MVTGLLQKQITTRNTPLFNPAFMRQPLLRMIQSIYDELTRVARHELALLDFSRTRHELNGNLYAAGTIGAAGNS